MAAAGGHRAGAQPGGDHAAVVGSGLHGATESAQLDPPGVAAGHPAGAVALPALRATADRSGDDAVRGPVTARLVQHLLEVPGRRWTPTELAALDGATTVATGSRLLAELRRLGLATVEPDGRRRPHRIVDPALLLDWLGDRREGRVLQQHGYLRARDVEQLIETVSRRIEESRLRAVLTGPAAALV